MLPSIDLLKPEEILSVSVRLEGEKKYKQNKKENEKLLI